MILDQSREEAATGKLVSRADIEARLRKAISGAVANSNGEEYQGLYPIKDDLLVFGAQGIGVDDGARFMMNESSLQWDGETLAVPAQSEAPQIEHLPFSPDLLNTVDELELSVRTENCLSYMDIKYIGDLVQKSEAELLHTPNFSPKSLHEIKEELARIGLHLSTDVPGWPPENVEQLATAYSQRLTA